MIKAEIIADSRTEFGDRLTTFELEFPRWILAEFNTHRQLSRNSASSRAIPIKANIENILNNTATPVHWGLNQPGMVADNEVNKETADIALSLWLQARDNAIFIAQKMTDLGIHKQIVNRLIENFTYQKVIVTATEWDNFFWLRNHKDAQPEIRVLAEKMLQEYNGSTPEILTIGEWHTPYVEHYRSPLNGELMYIDNNDNFLSLEEALKVSASCCAQVSYRKTDDSLDKALKVFDMLNLTSEGADVRMHSSPIEHQGTPIDQTYERFYKYYNGITHEDFNGSFWSGNFKGWVQYRHTYENESCTQNPDIIK